MCLFCKIISGEIPSHKIYEDEDVYAFLDISDDCLGHTLVVPKKHFDNLLDIDTELFARVMAAAQKIAKHFVDNCGFTGVNVLNNSGVDADQSVMHLHIHILPRKNGDGKKMWPDLEKLNTNLGDLCEKLRI